MKKFIPVLFSAALLFTLIVLNANPASADDAGCNRGGPYSVTTGQLCSKTTISACAPGDLYSSVTGQPCSSSSTANTSSTNTDTVAQFNSLLGSGFTLGTKSSAISSLQQFLQTQGYYFGKIDGKYGKITVRAVSDFESDNNINANVSAQSGTQTSTSNINSTSNTTTTSGGNPIFGAFSSPQSIQASQPASFSFSATDPNNYNLSWAIGWGDTAVVSASTCPASEVNNNFSASHTYPTAGTYNLTVYVNDCHGGSSQTSFSVNVVNGNQATDPVSLYDYNHNGFIDNSDLTYALQLTTKTNSIPCPTDRKCILNTLDLIAIKNALANSTSATSESGTGGSTVSTDIAVVAPAGAESLNAGSQFTIKWNAPSNVSTVNLNLNQFTPASNFYAFLYDIGSNISNTGSYVWTVPNTYSGPGFAISVSASGYSQAYSNKFNIIAPPVSVVDNTGGVPISGIDPISLYDYNHNGVIDSSDLTFALQVETGINGTPCPSDRKCTLNTLDLVAIQKLLNAQ